MKETYLFDLLEEIPEKLIAQPIVEQPEISEKRILQIVTAEISRNKKSIPKKKFGKKLMICIAAALSAVALSAAAIKTIMDFNMDQPESIIQRQEIFNKEQIDYYHSLYQSMEKMTEYCEENNWSVEPAQTEIYINAENNAAESMIYQKSQRILEILKKYHRLDEHTRPEDVCDTLQGHKLGTNDDILCYCDFIDKCIELFNDDNLIQAEKVYLEIHLEESCRIIKNALFAISEGHTETTKEARNRLNETSDNIIETIEKTLVSYNINDTETIQAHLDEFNKERIENLVQNEKIYVEDMYEHLTSYNIHFDLNDKWERIEACLFISDWKANKERLDIQKYTELRSQFFKKYLSNFYELKEEKEKETNVKIDDPYTSGKQSISNLGLIPGYPGLYIVPYLEDKADVKTREEHFIKMQQMLDRFGISYDCTTDDYYHDFNKYYDFFVLCCHTAEEHCSELTVDEKANFGMMVNPEKQYSVYWTENPYIKGKKEVKTEIQIENEKREHDIGLKKAYCKSQIGKYLFDKTCIVLGLTERTRLDQFKYAK